jgi:outer membrane murein-binding lipoprotein Lpp
MKKIVGLVLAASGLILAGCALSPEEYEARQQQRLADARELVAKIESGECRHVDRTGSRARPVLVCDGANAAARRSAQNAAQETARRLQNSGGFCTGGNSCGQGSDGD